MTPNLYRNIVALVLAARKTLDAGLILPTLCLIYTAIDIVAGLERRPNEGTRAAFERWCAVYLLKAKHLGCSPVDLFAARCGILHTASADADLVRAGKARVITYAWGAATVADLQEVARRIEHESLAVHIEDLLAAFSEGTVLFFQDIERDPARKEHVLSTGGVWLTEIKSDLVRRFLDLTAVAPEVSNAT